MLWQYFLFFIKYIVKTQLNHNQVEVGLTRLWVSNPHTHRKTFRPLPDHPRSWFSACNPILTQLDDSCKKKFTQIFFDPNFFWPTIFLTQIFFDRKIFPIQIFLTQKNSRPTFFDQKKFPTQIFVDQQKFPTQFFFNQNFFSTQILFDQKKFRPKFFLTKKNFRHQFFLTHHFF